MSVSANLYLIFNIFSGLCQAIMADSGRVEVKYSAEKRPNAKSSMYAPYPNATSRIIITAKPTIAPMVAMSVLCSPPSCWDSGMSSSTTT
jgi:hypothetical protein